MRKFKVTVEGQTYDVLVEEVSDKAAPVTPVPTGENFPAPAAIEKTTVSSSPASLPLQADNKKAVSAGEQSVPAPMPGSVIEVRVKSGDVVSEGDLLLILEAMKMENEITSPVGGTVTKVTVKGGDTVNSGDPLVYIE